MQLAEPRQRQMGQEDEKGEANEPTASFCLDLTHDRFSAGWIACDDLL